MKTLRRLVYAVKKGSGLTSKGIILTPDGYEVRTVSKSMHRAASKKANAKLRDIIAERREAERKEEAVVA